MKLKILVAVGATIGRPPVKSLHPQKRAITATTSSFALVPLIRLAMLATFPHKRGRLGANIVDYSKA